MSFFLLLVSAPHSVAEVESNLIHFRIRHDVNQAVSMTDRQSRWNGDYEISRALVEYSKIITSNSVVVVEIDQLSISTVESILNDFLLQCRLMGARFVYVRLPSQDEELLSIVHWICPYESPRDLASTLFFLDHGYSGKGDEGVDGILNALSDRRPKYVLFAGNHYAVDGWGPDESPFEGREEELKEVLKEKQIQIVYPEIPMLQGPAWRQHWVSFAKDTTKRNSIILYACVGAIIFVIISGVLVLLMRRRKFKLRVREQDILK